MNRKIIFLSLLTMISTPAFAQGVFMQQGGGGIILEWHQTPGLNFNQSPPGWQGFQQSPVIPPGHVPGQYGGWYWIPPSVPNPSQSLQGHGMAPDWSGNGGCPPGTRPGTIWGGGGWQADGQCHLQPNYGHQVRPLPHTHAHPGLPQQNMPAQRRPWRP